MTLLAGLGSAGCGTILYPERRGQPSGRLDWGVVAMDGVGLILFFVPGLIAFAVDFATGAIYLPYDGDPSLAADDRTEPRKTIVLKPKQLTRAEIAAAVSAETGREVTLEEGTYYTAKLSDLDRFWPAVDQLAAACDDPHSPEIVRAQSP